MGCQLGRLFKLRLVQAWATSEEISQHRPARSGSARIIDCRASGRGTQPSIAECSTGRRESALGPMRFVFQEVDLSTGAFLRIYPGRYFSDWLPAHGPNRRCAPAKVSRALMQAFRCGWICGRTPSARPGGTGVPSEMFGGRLDSKRIIFRWRPDVAARRTTHATGLKASNGTAQGHAREKPG